MRTATALLVLALLAGCNPKLKRLSADERDHYYALKIFMSDDQEKAFLKFRSEEERNAFLREQGLWDRFYKYPAERRQEIVAGEVKEGWTEDQMLMAWGQPYEKRRAPGRPAERSEIYVYRFEVDREGFIRVWAPGSKTEYKAVSLHQLEIFVDDGRLSEMIRKEGWE